MKSTRRFVRLALAAAVLAASSMSQAAPPQGPRYAPGVVLVEYKGEASASIAAGRRELARSNARQRVEATSATRVSPRAVNLEKLRLPAGKLPNPPHLPRPYPCSQSPPPRLRPWQWHLPYPFQKIFSIENRP